MQAELNPISRQQDIVVMPTTSARYCEHKEALALTTMRPAAVALALTLTQALQ
jgi:hypothetical protein